MSQNLISQESEDLIIAEEVTGKKTYEARFRRPERPGGGSGITIGIGYDVGTGVKDAAQLRADWSGHISHVMVEALIPCIGVKGPRAQALLPKMQSLVDVPWDAAMAVFEQVDVPRWYGICKKALPNFEELSPDCRGALVSLAYNRGPAFNLGAGRYREMRAIKTLMAAKKFNEIPTQFRKMQRLWTTLSVRGVRLRREHEARLFEKGLSHG